MNADATSKSAGLTRFSSTHLLEPARRFLLVLLVFVVACEVSFAAESAERAPEATPSEHVQNSASNRLTAQGRLEHHQNAPASANADVKNPQQSQAVDAAPTERVRPVPQTLRHLNDKHSANGQPIIATGQNPHLPALNNPAGTVKEGFTANKMQHQQRSQEVRPPPLQLSSPVTDSLHSRIPAPAHLGGPSSTAKDNAALNGLNGTGMKRKP
jgi:hypothetical protein